MEEAPDFTALFEKYPSLRKAVETGVESHDGREEELRSFILSHPDIELIKDNPAKLLSAMDEFSAKHDFLISVGRHKTQILSGLVANEKPNTVVELGGYLGYSAILFADAMRRYREPNQRLRVWSLEMNSGFAAIAREMIELAGLSDIITVVEGSASESLRKLQNDGSLVEIDLLFLDHEEQLYLTDLKACMELGLLKNGAVIAADNVVRPGAPEYREFVRTKTSLKSEGIRGLIQPGDLEDELEISHVIG
ncbi:S-adenosyl-L-methionine-dependent methyltransferase [Xylogone sp. PMI_703]|nr:S-adenosyl-L-methionine-dependent methyltransferase [Xylogone sp. PMI_703]